MTLRERVARAICEKNCDNPDEPQHAFRWQGYIPHAEAAIAAAVVPELLAALQDFVSWRDAAVREIAWESHLAVLIERAETVIARAKG